MLVPEVVAASTSPSPVNVPLVISTVAPARSRLSGSVTDAAFDSVTAEASCVNCAPVATLLKLGG